MSTKQAYQKAYRQANLARAAQYRRQWDQANPDKVKLYRERSRPAKKLHQQKYPERYREASQRKYLSRIGFIQAVKLYYGCCNPTCQHDGDFHPAQLEFHHLCRADKAGVVAARMSRVNVASEMRKCTVLCTNCHRLETYADLDCTGFQRCNVTDELKIVGYV